MELLTETIRRKLLQNGGVRTSLAEDEDANSECDFHPVVKLFTPDGQCTWLLTELDPEDPDIAFGLCDLGLGDPDLGSVRISELRSVRGTFGLLVEREQYFVAKHRLSIYARAAWNARAITEDERALEQVARSVTEEG